MLLRADIRGVFYNKLSVKSSIQDNTYIFWSLLVCFMYPTILFKKSYFIHFFNCICWNWCGLEIQLKWGIFDNSSDSKDLILSRKNLPAGAQTDRQFSYACYLIYQQNEFEKRFYLYKRQKQTFSKFSTDI